LSLDFKELNFFVNKNGFDKLERRQYLEHLPTCMPKNQRVANRLLKFPNAAANLQRCLAGDWKIYILPQEISSTPPNRRWQFAAALGRRAAILQRRLSGDWQIRRRLTTR